MYLRGGITTFISAVIFFLLIPLGLNAQEYPERTYYKAITRDGAERWHATADITSHSKKDNTFILTEKGEGFYTGFKGRISWISTLEFESLKDSIKPIAIQKEIFDKENKNIVSVRWEFDHAKRIAHFFYTDKIKKKKVDSVFEYQYDINDRLALCLYAQKLLKNNIAQKRVQLITDEPQIYNLDISMHRKPECIKIDKKPVKAYRGNLDLDIGFFNILRPITPKAKMWFSKEPDFELLQYSGPEANPYSINIDIVVTKDGS